MNIFTSSRQNQTKVPDLFPNLDAGQLPAVEQNLDRYVEIVLRIYERIFLDPAAYEQFKLLTGKPLDGRMRRPAEDYHKS